MEKLDAERINKSIGLDKLQRATTYSEFIQIAEEHHLSSNLVGELLPTFASRNFYQLKNYTKLDCVSLLKVLQAKADIANHKFSTPQDVLQAFLGIGERQANEVVYQVNKINEEASRQFAENVARGMDFALNVLVGAQEIKTKYQDKTMQERFKEEFEAEDSVENTL